MLHLDLFRAYGWYSDTFVVVFAGGIFIMVDFLSRFVIYDGSDFSNLAISNEKGAWFQTLSVTQRHGGPIRWRADVLVGLTLDLFTLDMCRHFGDRQK